MKAESIAEHAMHANFGLILEMRESWSHPGNQQYTAQDPLQHCTVSSPPISTEQKSTPPPTKTNCLACPATHLRLQLLFV